VTTLLVFGADSLVGSWFVEHTAHRVQAAGPVDPRPLLPRVERFELLDLRQPGGARSLIAGSPAEAVINFAAITDVDGAERERPPEPSLAAGAAFSLNALAPEEIARACAETGRPLVHLSTDFVFDGRSGPYDEREEPAPFSPQVSWYGWTKGEGERRLRAAHPRATVLRIAYPYRARFPGREDFARRWVALRAAGRLPPMFADQTFTPTWIPDVAAAIEALLARPEGGTFHAASPEPTTPLEFATRLFSQLDGRAVELPGGSMEQFLRRPGATPRPRRGGLKVGQLLARGVRLTAWHEGIARFLEEGGAR
jgi:dTDP-4-dehydrorhamnose reductase